MSVPRHANDRASETSRPKREIRTAQAGEAAAISRLAIESKAQWAYSPEQLAVFRGELTLTEAELVSHRAHVAVSADGIVGFYTLLASPGEVTRMELEHLFVAPAEIGAGTGTLLFAHACETARTAGADILEIQSDPNAAGFYLRVGASQVAEIPSSIPGRTIPVFQHRLESGGRRAAP